VTGSTDQKNVQGTSDMSSETNATEHAGFLLFLALVTIGLVAISLPFAAPLLWATLAAIMFHPLHSWFLAKRPNAHNSAAIATMLVITFAVLLPAFWVGSKVVQEAAVVFTAFQNGDIDVAAWFSEIFAALPASVQQSLASYGLSDFNVVQSRLQELATESAGLIARQAVAIGGGALSWFLAFGVGLYVTFFLIRDGQQSGTAIVKALPLNKDIALQLAERFVAIVRATIKGSGIVALMQGLLGAITFWIVGMPSIALFGVMMAIFSLLPAIGPAIVWVPVAVYLLAIGAVWEGVVVIISGVAVIGMIDNALRPILVGRDTGIPDWIVLVTTLGGIATLGIAGVVVGPLLAGLFLAGWAMLQDQRSAPLHPSE
jgi:predicted PurR-regulated permease PerM